MGKDIKVEDNRGWFKKITDTVNPVYHIAEAVNPRETQASARERATGGDPKKAEHFNNEHYKFAKSADVELSHNGTFTKGFTNGFVDGLSGGQFATDPDFRKFHRDVAAIEGNGGSHTEYAKMRDAAGDPTKTVSEGAEKQQTKVTVHEYADFCKVAAEKGLHGQYREAAVKDTIQDLKSGKTLKQSVNEIENGGYTVPRAVPVPETSQNGTKTESQNMAANSDINTALAKVDTSSLKMTQDSTTQGVAQGYQGANAQVAQTNTVQV